MAENGRATVQTSSLNWRAVYPSTIAEKWREIGRLADALHKSLHNWGASLDGFVLNQDVANLGQTSLAIRLSNNLHFFAKIADANLLALNASWADAPMIQSVAGAAFDTLKSIFDFTFDRFELSLDMHLALTDTTGEKLTAPFAPTRLASPELKAFGFTLHRQEGFWHLDQSQFFGKALYMRIFHRFDPDTQTSKIAEQILEDETDFLELVGLRIS